MPLSSTTKGEAFGQSKGFRGEDLGKGESEEEAVDTEEGGAT